MKDHIRIFDTTMRDGAQADHPMTPDEKVAIARWLERLNVDVIEAGFPISSPAEVEAIQKISKAVSTPIICALAHLKQNAVEAAARSLEFAKKPRIHVFASTSDIHIEKKLRSTRAEVLSSTINEVRRAKKYVEDVQFSAEDATRTDIDYLIEITLAAIDAGATTVNIPDTVGYAQVREYEEIIDEIYEKNPDPGKVIISVHCHDDLGQAVANSLAGVLLGAGQVEGCFLGIGERAGNAALEEVIMILNTRADFYKATTGINIELLWPFCQFLSKLINYPISDHKAIIGKYAFADSSGIHFDGVKKDPITYHIMKPESIGWSGETMALTSHLGRSGLQTALESIGYTESNLADAIHDEFKILANRKGRLDDDDLRLLVQEYQITEEATCKNLFVFEKGKIHFSSDDNGDVGTVEIRRGGVVHSATAYGDGPVNALCSAIDKALFAHSEDVLSHEPVHFDFTQGKGGSEAIGWMSVKFRIGDRIGFGRGGSTNMAKACAIAYLNAINHMINAPVSSNEQEELRKVYKE